MTRWVGVDVGGSRKGFHLAVLDANAAVRLSIAPTVDDAVAAIVAARPDVVAIDSPRSTALPGATARACELDLNRLICGIRWTPDARRVLDERDGYYEWIRRGLALYTALPERLEVIECFPTASWTRWGGRRGERSRAAWSASILASSGVDLPPRRLSQDHRDAIGAALTARAFARGQAESIGEIVVPAVVEVEPLDRQLADRIGIIDGHANVWSAFTDSELFGRVIRALAEPFRGANVTKIVGIEARGFLLGGAVAIELGAGFAPIRKAAGLLPGDKVQVEAGTDYRGNRHVLALQRDAILTGDRVVLVDDWAELGAQASAARELVERCGGIWLGVSVMVDQLPEGKAQELGRYEALVHADSLAWTPEPL